MSAPLQIPLQPGLDAWRAHCVHVFEDRAVVLAVGRHNVAAALLRLQVVLSHQTPQLALWKGEHMRLTTIASRLPPRWRSLADTLAVAAPCLFLAVIIGPALDFVEGQSFVETPALGWPDSVRAASVVTGCALMLILCVLRLLQHRLRDVLSVAAILGIIAVGLWLMAGQIVAMGNLNLLVFFVLLLGAGVLIGVPIAFAFGLATVAALLTTTTTPLAVLPGRMDEGMSSLILLAVPLFIMLGRLIEMTEMAKAMVAFLASLLGHVRGGLQYVLLGAMLLVSAMVIILAMGVGLFAPPFGLGYYAACTIGRVNPDAAPPAFRAFKINHASDSKGQRY